MPYLQLFLVCYDAENQEVREGEEADADTVSLLRIPNLVRRGFLQDSERFSEYDHDFAQGKLPARPTVIRTRPELHLFDLGRSVICPFGFLTPSAEIFWYHPARLVKPRLSLITTMPAGGAAVEWLGWQDFPAIEVEECQRLGDGAD